MRQSRNALSAYDRFCSLLKRRQRVEMNEAEKTKRTGLLSPSTRFTASISINDIIGQTGTLVDCCQGIPYARIYKSFFLFLFVAVVDPLHARYLIAHKLASGGFGEVYAGVRKKDGMPVALKVVPKRRMREISTVSRRATHTHHQQYKFSRSLLVRRQSSIGSLPAASCRQSEKCHSHARILHSQRATRHRPRAAWAVLWLVRFRLRACRWPGRATGTWFLQADPSNSQRCTCLRSKFELFKRGAETINIRWTRLGSSSRYQRWKLPSRYAIRTNLFNRFWLGCGASWWHLHGVPRHLVLCRTGMGDLSALLRTTPNSLVVGHSVIRLSLRRYTVCWWIIDNQVSTSISQSPLIR